MQALLQNQSHSRPSDPTASRWHLWAQIPPSPMSGLVRCRRGGCESLVEAGYQGPGWPPPNVYWEETSRCRPLRIDMKGG